MRSEFEKRACVYKQEIYNILASVFLLLNVAIFTVFLYYFYNSEIFREFYVIVGVLSLMTITYLFSLMFLTYAKKEIGFLKLESDIIHAATLKVYKWRYYSINSIGILLIILCISFIALQNSFTPINARSLFLIFLPALFVPLMSFLILREKDINIKNTKIIELTINVLIILLATIVFCALVCCPSLYQGNGIKYLTYIICVILGAIVVLNAIIMQKPKWGNITDLYKLLTPMYFTLIALLQYIKELNTVIYYHLTVRDIFIGTQLLVAFLVLLLLIKIVIDWIKLKKFSFNIFWSCFFCALVVGAEISTIVVAIINSLNPQVRIWHFPGLMSGVSLLIILPYLAMLIINIIKKQRAKKALT